MEGRVMVMAGGTGGHVFPALAVADELRQRGAEVFWLGTPNSFEARVVPEHGYELEQISIKGLRGKGLMSWLTAPFKLLMAMNQAAAVIRRRKPNLVIGMGGFASGPGGLVARLLGKPLVIHEQNAVPGMTNRWLARLATRVLEAFPGSFSTDRSATVTGNPVRADIAAVAAPQERFADRQGSLRLLVLGGSQGAQALNETVPQAVAAMDETVRPVIRHQAGRNKLEATQAIYQQMAVDAEVMPFVKDMAEAYAWADLVVCRAGALTVAELAAAGVGSVLVPFPHAVDDHQTRNGRYLADGDAALLIDQSQLSEQWLRDRLMELSADREKVLSMAQAARALALPTATVEVADICESVLTEGGQRR
ncbi:MAG: undecaprenyldiphospho-muramoylpentapeptide beta-N-acetylglucosaminyltransferase [Chromatiales bacterium]|nr:undecaprenyldiphospho-muramoylpentapeptide beta-N-acetylglucosaminyltransferase [Chromatiales bacterium]